ncbi:homeobox protein BarH-like 1 isoform X4 [Triplophysa dalaica]|uniref:homeobox protein BarH-like 1 isoform X4 n=1 Tax=Triplophysa dalaica TaxID=1582913 RepID=UPI0024DFB739|nr:homeobox protein BarH-like 1 isoform X4 [Triplophysa dalaica]
MSHPLCLEKHHLWIKIRADRILARAVRQFASSFIHPSGARFHHTTDSLLLDGIFLGLQPVLQHVPSDRPNLRPITRGSHVFCRVIYIVRWKQQNADYCSVKSTLQTIAAQTCWSLRCNCLQAGMHIRLSVVMPLIPDKQSREKLTQEKSMFLKRGHAPSLRQRIGECESLLKVTGQALDLKALKEALSRVLKHHTSDWHFGSE